MLWNFEKKQFWEENLIFLDWFFGLKKKNVSALYIRVGPWRTTKHFFGLMVNIPQWAYWFQMEYSTGNFLIKFLNLISFQEWTWWHCVFYVRTETRPVVRSQENMCATIKSRGWKLHTCRDTLWHHMHSQSGMKLKILCGRFNQNIANEGVQPANPLENITPPVTTTYNLDNAHATHRFCTKNKTKETWNSLAFVCFWKKIKIFRVFVSI